MAQPSIERPLAPWRLPDRLQNRGTKLFAQQAWGWGCDVRRAAGNLLLAHGFVRLRRPEGVEGSSMYVVQPDPATQIVLWTFGMFYGRTGWGGLYLDRFHFDPRLTSDAALPPAIWRPEGLPPFTRPSGTGDCARLAYLLPAAIDWIAGYETAVLTTLGLDYRRECLAQWSRRKSALAPERLVPQWQSFRTDCVDLLQNYA
jgi:hypothetical protein